MKHVGIYIFDEVEVLDFAGPFEVFNVTAQLNDPSPLTVYTIGKTGEPIKARGGLTVTPHYSFENMPKTDVLLIPGGAGVRALLEQDDVIEWVKQQEISTERLLSVCTGALLLAKAGLLDGLRATTHASAFDRLRELAPTATVEEDRRYVDNGNIVLSGGISAGIDMALYVLNQLVGEWMVRQTLKEMEYTWVPEVG